MRTRYRWIAPVYDAFELRPFRRLREVAVGRLEIGPGAVVLDLACGTGLSFEALETRIGSSGTLVGVDLDSDMLRRAARRITARGWRNVRLVESDALRLALSDESVDAVLYFYAHDVLTSPVAVQAALAALKPGGRFVAAGGQRARGPASPLLNATTLAFSWPFVTRLRDLSRPWLHLGARADPVEVEERFWGTAYLVTALRRASGGHRSPMTDQASTA